MSSDGGDRGRLLDHSQSIIERLAGNSFSIKGWAVTVVSLFLGFGVKDAKPQVAFVGVIPTIIFWMIDAYYLSAERHFREFYNTLASSSIGTLPMPNQVSKRSAILKCPSGK